MPKSTPSSQPAKGQKSISSFFTSTPRPTVNGPQILPSQASPPPAVKSKESNIYDADTDEDGEEEEEEPVVTASRRSSSKRPLNEDANAANEGESLAERPAKKAKNDADGQTEGGSVYFGSKGKATASASTNGKTKASPRTEKYIYRSSAQSTPNEAIPEVEEEDDNAAEKARKEELHRKWVKKMSGVSVGRRWHSEENTPTAEDGEEGEEEEEPLPQKTKKKGAKTGKLTPLEIQVLDIKRGHMDTLLIVEVGYKFKFFGEDARVAAKELSIVCIPGKFRYDEHPSEAHLDRFASASIPVHRLPVHAKRLVAAGHKIGVVRQIETAALKKAGDNRNAPFTRKLTNVYTKGTYIDDVDGLDHPGEGAKSGAPATGYLLCVTEAKAKGWGTDEKVDVGILAVQPATGDIIYDTFEDGFMRNEIETRLLHLAPCEFLIVGELTKATDKLVKHLSASSANVFGDRIRVEHVAKGKTMAAEAHSHVTQFYANKLKAQEAGSTEQTLLDKVLKLPEQVTVCLSAMIAHMTEYGLEHVFDLTKYFQSFSVRSHMLLNGNTLTSLEVYQNQTDQSEKGSLFWTLNKTQTRFGQRLLRKWVGRPLLDKEQLEQRQDAVEELANGHQTPKFDKLESLLRSIRSDLERSLIRIYYGKCTRPELLIVLKTLQSISNEYAAVRGPADAGFNSSLISNAITSLPSIGDVVISFLSKINAEAARKDDKYAFFHPDHETETITDHKLGIAAVEQDLDSHRSAASSSIKKSKTMPYVTVAGIEYLFEIPNTELKKVPASWNKISGTKKVSRFHTPEVVKMLRERDQHKESLSAACDAAFLALLSELSTNYALLRDTISSLATLDCLLSLSIVARLPGYSKPTILPSGPNDPSSINIVDGRHPMVEQLLPSYIPNSTSLSTAPDSTRALLITGPNMGGKSSFVRSTALLILLAQIGSFVPCTHLSLSLFTQIHTRMGAYDSLFTSQSTFAVELSETSAILKTADSKSLIILDELGRGTSTHDGVAIAGAVLDYVVRETKGLCLFITHYQSLAAVERNFGAGELRNVHMRFESTKTELEDGCDDVEGDKGDEEITFLYEVAPGVAHRSYGLNVARLAQVPKSVVDLAAQKSAEMERSMVSKRLGSLAQMMGGLMGSQDMDLDRLIVGIEEL